METQIFTRTKLIIKNHYGAIILAALTGLIYFLPNIILSHVSPGILRLNFEEAYSYGVKIRDVIDGHFIDGDPYLYEYKNIFSTWDYYPLALVIGTILRLIRFTNLERLFELTDLFLPPITFLIAYRIFSKITKSIAWSNLAAFIFVAFPNIQMLRALFSGALYQGSIASNLFSLAEGSFNPDFSRFFVPSLTMIFFSGFLLALYNFLSGSEINRRKLIRLGVNFGLLFYVYFYYWVFASIIFGFLSVLLFIFDRMRFRKFLYAGILGLAISALHWLRYIAIFRNPNFSDYAARIGIEHVFRLTGGSVIQIIGVCAGITLLWFFRGRLGTAFVLFASSVLGSTSVALNLQLFTGFNPQPDHWGSRVNIYIYILVLLSFVFFALQSIFGLQNIKRARMFSWVASIFIIFLIVVACRAEFDQALKTSTYYGVSREAQEAFAWIDKNTPTDAVFLSPSQRTKALIPFFTHANVYVPPACLTLAPAREVISRHLDIYAAFKVPRDLFVISLGTTDSKELPASHFNSSVYTDEIESNQSIFCDTFKGGSNRVSGGNDVRKIPQDVLLKLENDFDVKSGVVRFSNLPYRADYIFWGPGERLISRLVPEKDQNLSRVYQNSAVQIFKIAHPRGTR